MQRRRGAIKTYVGNELSRFCDLIKPCEVRALMQKSALDEHCEEVGLGTKITGHGRPSAKDRALATSVRDPSDL